jgi:integrase
MRKRIDNPEFTGPFAPMCEAFIKQRRALGISYNGQVWVLRRFDNLAKGFDIHDFKISRELAGAWIKKSPNESDGYHNTRLYTIWHFADFLVQQGYDSYWKRFKLRRNSTHVPYIFTKDEIRRIFAALDKMEYSPCSPLKHVMFPVLYRMLYGCGLRISDALHLTLGDINIENQMLHIQSGKNDKERLVPMSDSLTRYCLRLIKELHQNHDKLHMLFFSRDGKPYSISNIENTSARFFGILASRIAVKIWDLVCMIFATLSFAID